MSKEKEKRFELDSIVDDYFGALESEAPSRTVRKKPVIRPIHSDKWTIVDAFNTINENLPQSRLEKDLFICCAEAFSFLSDQLGFNPIQCAIIAMLVEEGKPMSYRQMGKLLGLSRLSIMTHYDDLEDLFKKRWVLHRGAQENYGMFEGYGLARGVVSAIRENRVFVPEDMTCTDTQEFVERLAEYMIENDTNDRNVSDMKAWIQDLVDTNRELPVCKTALALNDTESLVMLMLLVADYCNCNGGEHEGLSSSDLKFVFSHGSPFNCRQAILDLLDGSHLLFQENLVKHKCEDGMINESIYVLSSFMKNEILKDFKQREKSDKRVPQMNGFMNHRDITAKNLFYNPEEERQVSKLKNLLSEKQLPQVQKRLSEKGMRTGVCILMHGDPGTGKTATAFELARQTGRDIIQVQVTDFMNKYVGESESRLKELFRNYRACCKNSKTVPILLMNEGDAILSKRMTSIERSVDQMANALQNILLEEMENLEGIMIVTTNLVTNLDKAFERRFIFKIRFEKPGIEVKSQIWKSMIDDLDDVECTELASRYDISGGEIENIARKVAMEYVLTGEKPTMGMVADFAMEEKIKSNTRPVVGFNTCNHYV